MILCTCVDNFIVWETRFPPGSSNLTAGACVSDSARCRRRGKGMTNGYCCQMGSEADHGEVIQCHLDWVNGHQVVIQRRLGQVGM
jgi:hypothetical protein